VPPLVVALILSAALMHATWNALLRSGTDKLASITVMSILSGATAGPLCLIVPPLQVDVWPYVAGSAGMQVFYCVALARAYEHGELSQVYPLARGSAPMLVTVGAALLAGEWPPNVTLAGLILISAGVIGVGMGQGRLHWRATVMALLTGTCVAGYMVFDGLGVRLSGNAPSYIAWMMLAQAVPMPFAYRVLRRRWPPIHRDRETLKALGGGVLGLLGYGVVVWAMSIAPMASVSGLRETSILFAALIGVVFLREPFTHRRAASALAITVGVVCLTA
jgi:drug/metabolite transporter (DMT)-like permease